MDNAEKRLITYNFLTWLEKNKIREEDFGLLQKLLFYDGFYLQQETPKKENDRIESVFALLGPSKKKEIIWYEVGTDYNVSNLTKEQIDDFVKRLDAIDGTIANFPKEINYSHLIEYDLSIEQDGKALLEISHYILKRRTAKQIEAQKARIKARLKQQEEESKKHKESSNRNLVLLEQEIEKLTKDQKYDPLNDADIELSSKYKYEPVVIDVGSFKGEIADKDIVK